MFRTGENAVEQARELQSVVDLVLADANGLKLEPVKTMVIRLKNTCRVSVVLKTNRQHLKSTCSGLDSTNNT